MNAFPKTLPMTRPAPASTRHRRYPPSPTAARNNTNEKSPNRVSPQTPSDIGEYALNAGVPEPTSTSMCQKRVGWPRSSVSRMGQISKRGKLMMKASREAAASAGLPHRRSMVPMTKAPPEIPAKKKYRRMNQVQPGATTKCSPGISPHPALPQRGREMSLALPQRGREMNSHRGGGRRSDRR